MDNTFRINRLRVSIWLLFLVCFGVGVFLFDYYFLQPKASIKLINYSNILLTIWQVQATIATITFTATAFIVGRIDNTYYGISVKNLLYVSRINPKIILSFWETIVLSIIWIVFTFLPALLNNVAMSIYMLVVTICTTTVVIVECINVITKSAIFEEFAKCLINDIEAIILTNTYKLEYKDTSYQSGTKWHPTEHQRNARRQFDIIVNNLELEISKEIREKSLIFDDSTLQFYFKIMKEFSEKNESQFNSYMHYIVGKWISTAVSNENYSIIPNLINASFIYSIDHSTANLEMFMHGVYNSSIPSPASSNILDKLYEYIRFGLSDYSDFTLAILRIAIINCDCNVFSSTLKSFVLSYNFKRKEVGGKVILATIAYLYYLTFKEKEIELKPISNINIYDLLAQPIYEKKINDISKIFTLRDYIKDLDKLFGSFKEVLDLFKQGNHKWEYMPLGVAKWLHLERDIIEFITFFSILFFKTKYIDAIDKLSIDSLSQMLHYIDDNGNVKQEYITSYLSFNKWLTGKEYSGTGNISCESLYGALNQIIKRKLFEEAHSVKLDHAARAKSLDKLKSEVVSKLKESDMFLPNIAEGTVVCQFQHSELLHMSDWLNDQIVYGFDDSVKTIIEYEIYSKLSSVLNKEILPKVYENPDILLKSFVNLLTKYDALDIHLDTAFNFDVINELEYYENSISDKTSLGYIRGRLTNRGTMAQSFAQTVYIDSAKSALGFTFDENSFMVINDNLQKEHFSKHITQYEHDGRYLYKLDNFDTSIIFDKDELEEYLACSTFEVTFTFTCVTPNVKCGFIATTEEEQE